MIKVGKAEKVLPNSLRRRIYTFGISMTMMIVLIGVFLGLMVLHSINSYQDVMNQLTEIHQLKVSISTVGEMVQNRVVLGEENDTECLRAWEKVNRQINGLETKNTSIMVRLLMEDLQAYQRNTNGDFQKLMLWADGEDISGCYQAFLVQQEDRQFLCDQILKHLTSYMAEHYSVIMRENTQFLAGFIVVVVSLILLAGSFSYTMTQSIYKPVQLLTAQTEKIMEGDYQMEDLPVVEMDEIGQLTEAFNEMKNRVRQNFRDREELWRLESLLQDAEFRALQSQVNPHFLFNVLSVATEAALLENADRTVDIIENISYMLHYGLTSVRDNSWLAEELKMVRSYLFLQQERFGERITFQVSLPEEPPVMRIPGMTLQPIVENAVKHGVERMMAGGCVRISLVQTPESVEICVQDNGGGMSLEQVDALNRGERVARGDAGSTGLGLANVISRMAIFYGRTGLLRVESEEGKGTRVYLTYLVREEG